MFKPFVYLICLAAPATGIAEADPVPLASAEAAATADSGAVSQFPTALPQVTANAPAASASIANPATSVIGWFQAVSGNDRGAQENPFELREAEIAFQSQVDPFAKAEFFMSASPEGLDLEEGYITWIALPGGGQAKVGKFRTDVGKFNRTHPPETPFADRPLAARVVLGEEGLTTIGVSLSALVPNPLNLYWDLVANVGAPPDSEESPLFQPQSRSDLLGVGRTSVFIPIGDSGDLNLGASYANALAREELRVEGNRAQLVTADLTVHWKNPRRSIYRSVLAQVEATAERGSRSDAPTRKGVFGYAIYQIARQWKVGLRYDWTDLPGGDAQERGGLALLSYQPSEFSTLSLQSRRVHEPDGTDHDTAFFKWTFNIGPHGAHPY